jgi:hypothetical protein
MLVLTMKRVLANSLLWDVAIIQVTMNLLYFYSLTDLTIICTIKHIIIPEIIISANFK